MDKKEWRKVQRGGSLMDKKEWRKKIVALQEKLAKEERDSLSQLIYEQVIHYESWQKARSIALFHSIGQEVDTLALLKEGWINQKKMYLPKCFPSTRKMKFYQVDSFEQLEVVYMGIPEPKVEGCMELEIQELDLLIVPGVVFDREGYRLGYGGGYYDRFLEHAPDSFEKLSLAFSLQIVPVGAIPKEPFDIPVDTLITEREIILCRQARRGKHDGSKESS